jgi:hypothetical protein
MNQEPLSVLGALLHNLAFVHDQDQIVIADGTQPVRYYN